MAADIIQAVKDKSAPIGMRAVVVQDFGMPDMLNLHRDVPTPEIKDDEVLVEVYAAGVSPVDTWIRAGIYSKLPPLPYVPGNDISGTVNKCGKDVTGFAHGQQVASFIQARSGGYAEYAAVNAKYLMHLPRDYDLKLGAALGTTYFTAYRALFHRARAKPSDVVLINGAASNVGLAALQMAIARGCTVWATAESFMAQKILVEHGLTPDEEIFDHTRANFVLKVREACKKIGREGPDVIFETITNTNLAKDLELIAPAGSICCTASRGFVEIDPHVMMVKECTLYGVGMFNAGLPQLMETKARVEAGVRSGAFKPRVGMELTLNNVQQAHDQVLLLREGEGKIIMTVAPSLFTREAEDKEAA